jgi:predicted glutamine amidotransferase
MCRMFGYTGSSMDDIRKLYSSLISASENDIIGAKYGYSDHSDGYGVVIYSGDNLFHFRSSKPVYSEKIPLPEFSGEIHAIFHVLNAHDKNMVTPVFEHPFMETGGSSVIFMAHNGVVDKNMIMEKLGIHGIYNDTEAALAYINSVGLGSVDELEKFTVSSLNLIILSIDKGSRKASTYYKNFYRGVDKEDYLKMYTARMPGGIAVISSTMKEYGISGATPVNGTGLMKLGD